MITALVSCICSGQQSDVLWVLQIITDPIFSFRGGAQIEGTLDGCEVLVVSPHHLALFAHYTLSEKCP